MRVVRRVLLGLLVLFVALAGYFFVTFDPESYKPQIVAAVKQATGRDLRIRGHIGLALSLSPTIEVTDVTLSNPPGFSRPDMMTIGKLDLQLALLPLFGRKIEIDRLVLIKPDVRLETDAKDNPNWVFAPAEKPAPAATAAPTGPGGKTEPLALVVRVLRLDDGTFSYRNGRTGQLDIVAAKQIEVSTAAIDAPLHLTAAFSLDGADVTVTADTGPLVRLMRGGSAGAWPLKVAMTIAGAKIGLDGTIADPVAGTGVDLGLTANIANLAATGAALKQTFPGIEALVLSARLSGDPRKIALHDLKMTSSAGDLAGDISVVLGLPMDLTGTLKSDKLDLDALSAPRAVAAKPAGGGAPAGPVGPAGPAGPKARWRIPEQALPFGQLPMVNADLHVSIGVLHVGGADTKTIQAHARLKDGVLTLDPASAVLPEGPVAFTLSADAGKTAPPVHLTLRAPAIALAPLLASLHEPPYVSGNLEVIADLRGNGESPHAIAASLDGTLALIVPGGSIDLKRIGGSAAGVLQTLNPKAASGADVLRCFALRLDFAHGVGTARALTLGSGLLNVDGTGTINLADETLALTLRSHATVAGTAVTVPVNVFGSLAKPQTKVNQIGLADSNAAALGGLLGNAVGSPLGGQKPSTGDTCPAALAVARGQAVAGAGAAPDAPAPAPAGPAKPPNAGQLLKRLIH